MRLRELAAVRISYGYRRLHVLLGREEWLINHKRVSRLYRMEGLGSTAVIASSPCRVCEAGTGGERTVAERMLEYGLHLRSVVQWQEDQDSGDRG